MAILGRNVRLNDRDGLERLKTVYLKVFNSYLVQFLMELVLFSERELGDDLGQRGQEDSWSWSRSSQKQLPERVSKLHSPRSLHHNGTLQGLYHFYGSELEPPPCLCHPITVQLHLGFPITAP